MSVCNCRKSGSETVGSGSNRLHFDLFNQWNYDDALSHVISDTLQVFPLGLPKHWMDHTTSSPQTYIAMSDGNPQWYLSRSTSS